MKFVLKIIGNVIWKIFGGIAFSAVWYVLGVALTLTIIGFPLAIFCFRVGRLVWKPFGKATTIVLGENTFFNILWAFSVGMVMALLALSSCFLTAITLVGLPLSKQWLKVAKVSLFPFGAYIK